MHVKEHLPHFHRTPHHDADQPNAHRATCSCGEWEHSRPVNPADPLDRAEAENAWFQHVNPGIMI
jgi:hypothetical protein